MRKEQRRGPYSSTITVSITPGRLQNKEYNNVTGWGEKICGRVNYLKEFFFFFTLPQTQLPQLIQAMSHYSVWKLLKVDCNSQGLIICIIYTHPAAYILFLSNAKQKQHYDKKYKLDCSCIYSAITVIHTDCVWHHEVPSSIHTVHSYVHLLNLCLWGSVLLPLRGDLLFKRGRKQELEHYDDVIGSRCGGRWR